MQLASQLVQKATGLTYFAPAAAESKDPTRPDPAAPPARPSSQAPAARSAPRQRQQHQQTMSEAADGSSKIGGSTVVITGGSQGVGKALAQMYAREGRNVVVVARQLERLKAVMDECGELAGRPEGMLAVSADVGDSAAVARLVHAVQERFEHVDVVVNCAGICAAGPLAEMPPQDIARLLATNLLGPALVSRAFIPPLKASASTPTASRLRARCAPTIVMVNSFAARVPIRQFSVYCATKHGLAGLTDSLRYELQADGIHVAQVHPGIVSSDFLERATYYGQDALALRKSTESFLSSGMAQTPEQVARAVMRAVSKGQREVTVGPTFKAMLAAYRVMGLNPLAFL